MRVCGLPVLSAASLSETERGAGGADTADPSSTATAAQPMRVGSAASAAGAPAQTTPSDCKLGANLSGNALGEDVSVETTRVLQLDPASTARTANAGPALPRGAGISALRHIDANNSAFNMLNEAGAAAALTCAAAAAAVAADAAPATLPPAHPARPPCPPARKGSSPSHWSGHRWATFPSKVKRSQLRALLPALALAYRLPPPPADPPPARPPTRRLCRLSPARHRPRLSPPAASRRPPRQLARRPVVSPVACPPSPPLADHHASLAAALSSRLSPARPRPRPLLPPPPSPHPPAASPLARSLARPLAPGFLLPRDRPNLSFLVIHPRLPPPRCSLAACSPARLSTSS